VSHSVEQTSVATVIVGDSAADDLAATTLRATDIGDANCMHVAKLASMPTLAFAIALYVV
jgi:hypothetical protein